MVFVRIYWINEYGVEVNHTMEVPKHRTIADFISAGITRVEIVPST